MALADQIGSPYKVTIGTPALTFEDVMDGEWDFDPEVFEHFNGKNAYPRKNIGNVAAFIRFKTSDMRGFTSLIKGMDVEDVKIFFKPTITDVDPSDGSLTQVSGDISIAISNCYVSESIKVTNDSSKKAAEFQLAFKAQVDPATGDDPTITPDFSLGGEA